MSSSTPLTYLYAAPILQSLMEYDIRSRSVLEIYRCVMTYRHHDPDAVLLLYPAHRTDRIYTQETRSYLDKIYTEKPLWLCGDISYHTFQQDDEERRFPYHRYKRFYIMQDHTVLWGMDRPHINPPTTPSKKRPPICTRAYTQCLEHDGCKTCPALVVR